MTSIIVYVQRGSAHDSNGGERRGSTDDDNGGVQCERAHEDYSYGVGVHMKLIAMSGVGVHMICVEVYCCMHQTMLNILKVKDLEFARDEDRGDIYIEFSVTSSGTLSASPSAHLNCIVSIHFLSRARTEAQPMWL
ncbi:Uncharacterized protein TCM_033592 [Theobroma cacao]|uniref:Uncharacterized protein n=1 Tax=Theobroma cacao TaxID=3641 RepID=A0A061FIH5_THECC|nr:Uncharacterized protein TCM_033592 [Theobroma cacao]